MRHSIRRAARVILIATTLGCVSNRTEESAPRTDRNLLTQEQLRAQHFDNAYDAIEALRSNWLLTRGPDSFATPSVVWVYMDNVKLGGIETLRAVPIGTISTIQHLDPITSTPRYVVGHAAG